MPILVLLSLALQIGCAVHVVRTGRQYYWIWIILMAPFLGCVIYLIAELLPDLRNDPRSRRAARNMLHSFDPQRRKREIQHRLEIADTIENRRALAEESLKLGDFANAAELYRSVLTGVYKDDAAFLLGLAQAQAGMEDFPAARTTLDTLFAAHPNFRHNDAELLRARVLEADGQLDAALDHYRELSTSYPGEEARYRYGSLLKRRERFGEARAVFRDMQLRARHAPRYYRKKEGAWLDAAKRELASLGPG